MSHSSRSSWRVTSLSPDQWEVVECLLQWMYDRAVESCPKTLSTEEGGEKYESLQALLDRYSVAADFVLECRGVLRRAWLSRKSR